VSCSPAKGLAVLGAVLVVGSGCGGAGGPGRRYAGATEQRQPVVIRVNGDGNRMTFRIVWDARCGGALGGLAPITTSLRGLPVVVSQFGTFDEDVDYTYPLNVSATARVRGQVSGRISGDRLVTGVWNPLLTYEDAVSGERSRCDPGPIAFTARPSGT
jgi:hypothetical protein